MPRNGSGFRVRMFLVVLVAGIAFALVRESDAHKAHDEAKQARESVTPPSPETVTPPAATPVEGHGSDDGEADAELLPDEHAVVDATPSPDEHAEADAPPLPDEHAEHEHAAGADEDNGVPQPFAWLGKFHPALTHFPIALLSAAALAELLLIRRRTELFSHAVRFCVWIGAGGAVAAAVLGWFFAGFRVFDDEWVMTAHRWVGTGTALCAALVFVLCERAYASPESRRVFRVALFASAALVTAAGFLGGSLLYGLDHYAW